MVDPHAAVGVRLYLQRVWCSLRFDDHWGLTLADVDVVGDAGSLRDVLATFQQDARKGLGTAARADGPSVLAMGARVVRDGVGT